MQKGGNNFQQEEVYRLGENHTGVKIWQVSWENIIEKGRTRRISR